MWALIEKAKKEGLTEEEKEELQKLFLRVAQQDVRILQDEGLLAPDEDELTKCPKCGHIVPGNKDCEVCGCRIPWIRWCKSVHDLRLARGQEGKDE